MTEAPINVHRKLRSVLTLTGLVLLLSACSSTPERNPLPSELTLEASIPGIPNARFWGDEWPKYSLDRLENLSESELIQDYGAIYDSPHNYLAISGGGANGAYGAGLLSGWTQSGSRPDFTIVTGISTGALTAPFAFLGAGYDELLKEVYTTTSTEKIFTEASRFKALFGDSVVDTDPLRQLIEKYVTDDLMNAIEAEHAKGRRLYMGTVNLDAGRSMIWDIGRIASSNSRERLRLIHDVMMASTAIPVAFPPVIIPVEAANGMYDEMHVDGGARSQVFVYPADLVWRDVVQKLRVQGTPNVYIIRNGFLEPDFQGVERRIFPIASRYIDSLIQTQGIGDIYQIYALCVRDGNSFNLASIPSEFSDEPTEAFDPTYMSKLFDLGYKMASEGYPWSRFPPGFSPDL